MVKPDSQHSVPSVSIIVRTYNRENTISRTLESIQRQTFTDWEVLIVDNSSSDSTVKIATSFQDPRIKVHSVENHGIIALSINHGIKHAAGKYIAILDSDDWWSPNKLELSVNALRQGADLTYHDMVQVTGSNPSSSQYTHYRSRQLSSPMCDDLLVRGNCIPCSSVVVKTSLLKSIGGFSENPGILAAEDYDAWIRLSRLTDKLVYVHGPILYYSWNSENLSSYKLSRAYCAYLSSLYKDDFMRLGMIRPPWMALLLASCDRQAGFLKLIVNLVSIIFSSVAHPISSPRNLVLYLTHLNSLIFLRLSKTL